MKKIFLLLLLIWANNVFAQDCINQTEKLGYSKQIECQEDTTTTERIKNFIDPQDKDLLLDFSDYDEHTIVVYDILKEEVLRTTGRGMLLIKKSTLSPGTYYYKVDSNIEFHKIIKK